MILNIEVQLTDQTMFRDIVGKIPDNLWRQKLKITLNGTTMCCEIDGDFSAEEIQRLIQVVLDCERNSTSIATAESEPDSTTVSTTEPTVTAEDEPNSTTVSTAESTVTAEAEKDSAIVSTSEPTTITEPEMDSTTESASEHTSPFEEIAYIAISEEDFATRVANRCCGGQQRVRKNTEEYFKNWLRKALKTDSAKVEKDDGITYTTILKRLQSVDDNMTPIILLRLYCIISEKTQKFKKKLIEMGIEERPDKDELMKFLMKAFLEGLDEEKSNYETRMKAAGFVNQGRKTRITVRDFLNECKA